MAHAQIRVKPYSGTEEEDFNEFENLFRGFLAVSGINNAQQPNFLQLYLRDAALRFFQTLGPATRANLDGCFIALRDQFGNRDLQEVRVLKLESQRFDPKTDTPENFLVNLQSKAVRAYPEPNLPEVAALKIAGLDPAPAAAEQTRFDRETATRDERPQAAEDFKNEQIKRIFIKAMPGCFRSKIMGQPANTPVHDLCTFERQQMAIREMCRKEDYPEDGFNEVNETVSENLVNVLSKIAQTQQSIEKRLQDLTSKTDSHQTNPASSQLTHSIQPQQSRSPLGPQKFTQYRPQYPSYRGFNRSPWQNRGRFSNSSANFRPRFQQNINRPNGQNYIRSLMTSYSARTPNEPYISVTQTNSLFCFKCGYPNHRASQWTRRGPPPQRGTSFPFNQQKN